MNLINRPLKRQRRFQDDVDVPGARDASRARLKSCFEDVFAKYSHDFTGVGDEVDMTTGKIIVNNGHLHGMSQEFDAGSAPNEQDPALIDSEWASTSDEDSGDHPEPGPAALTEDELDAQAQLFGQNIAAEIMRIFASHRVKSRASHSERHWSKRDVTSPRDTAVHEPRSQTLIRGSQVDERLPTPRPNLSTPARVHAAQSSGRNAKGYSIWDPRPSPQPGSTGRHMRPDSSPRRQGASKTWTMEGLSTLLSLRAQRFSFEDIAKRIPDRTPGALQQQYYFIINSSRKRAEIEAYIRDVGLPYRSDALPSENDMSRDLDHIKWSDEELTRLLELRRGQGLSWREVAAEFPDRSWWAIKGKYSRLKPEEWIKAGFGGLPSENPDAVDNDLTASGAMDADETLPTVAAEDEELVDRQALSSPPVAVMTAAGSSSTAVDRAASAQPRPSQSVSKMTPPSMPRSVQRAASVGGRIGSPMVLIPQNAHAENDSDDDELA